MYRQQNNLVDYRKVPKQYYDGHQYGSKGEASYAQELNIRQKAGNIKSWEPHIPIELRVNGELITTYTIDFKVEYPDGTIEYVEIKGFDDNYSRLRWKLFSAIVPAEYPGSTCLKVMLKSRWPKRRFSKRWSRR